MKRERKMYESPQLEILQVLTEQGFAYSPDINPGEETIQGWE